MTKADCQHRKVYCVCKHCGAKTRVYQCGPKLLKDLVRRNRHRRLISGLDTNRKGV